MSAHPFPPARWFYFMLFCLLLGQAAARPAAASPPARPEDPGPDRPGVQAPALRFRPPAAAGRLADFIPAGARRLDWGSPAAAAGGSGGNGLVRRIGRAVQRVTPGRDTVLMAGEALLVYLENGTAAGELSLELGYLDGRPLPAGEEETAPRPAAPRPLLAFRIEAVEAVSDQAVDSFPRPVRLALDLREHGVDLRDSGGSFFLAFENPDSPGVYIDIPLSVHDPAGLISGETTHFSNWIAGWRPESWSLSWTVPAVAEFTGAATYQHPIDLPPGRAGLQPALALSYHSGGLNGAVRTVSAGSVAAGWSLTDIRIMRLKTEQSASGFAYADDFRLIIDGRGHRLVQGEAEGDRIRFYAEHAPSLRLYQVGGLRWNNDPSTHSYWIVQTGEGVTYRLGYTNNLADPSQADPSVTYQKTQLNGDEFRYEATAWHVDTITDSHGNQITYRYIRPERFESVGYWCPWGGVCSFKIWNYTSQVAEIRYNFRDVALPNDPVPAEIGRLDGDPAQPYATRIVFGYDPIEIRLASIEIYHGQATAAAASPPLNRRIEIEGGNDQVANPAVCDRRTPAGGYETRFTTTRVVRQIVEKAPAPDGGWYSRPATRFSYATMPALHHRGEGCFLFRYLEGIANGYGAETRFAYAGDNRVKGLPYTNCQGEESDPVCEERFPSVGYSYRVLTRRTTDGFDEWGIGDGFSEVRFAYEGVCYDQTSIYEPACARPETTAEFGQIGGHERVTATWIDFDGTTPLRRRIVEFHLDEDRHGRPWRERVGPPDPADASALRAGREQRVETDYQVLTFGPGAVFTAPGEVRRFLVNRGAAGDSVSQKTRYFYDAGLGYQVDQNGVSGQFGQVTHIEEFDRAEAALPYRTTRRWSIANTAGGYWIIRTKGEGDYRENSWELQQARWYYFDQGEDIAANDRLTDGRLWRERTASARVITCAEVAGPVAAGCTTAYQTIDRTFTYDGFGNIKSETDFSDFGVMTQNDAGDLVDIPPQSARRTVIDYDSDFNLYPLAVTNPWLHTTRYEFWGVAGVPLSGYQVQAGLLRGVEDPARMRTFYEYDPFGRLFEVVRGSEPAGLGNLDAADGNPVIRIAYGDNSWERPAGSGPEDLPLSISVRSRPGSFSQSQTGYDLLTVHYYDGFGREIQTQERQVAVEGEPVRQRRIVSLGYDALDRPACTTAPFAVVEDEGFWEESCFVRPHTRTRYHDQEIGRRTVVDPAGQATEHVEEVLRRTNDGTLIGPAGDPYRVQSTVDANGHARSIAWDSRGQTAAVIDYLPANGNNVYPVYGFTRYEYDWQGNLAAVENGEGQVTRLIYDDFGRKRSLEDPTLGLWRFRYDAAGNLIEQADGSGRLICQFYDDLDRLLRKTTAGAGESCPATISEAPASGENWLAHYLYDSSFSEAGVIYGGQRGRLTRVAWAPGEGRHYELFAYDEFGRLAGQRRVIDGRPFVLETLAFDDLDRPLRLSYPDGEIVEMAYDREGEDGLRIANGTLPLVNGLHSDELGRLSTLDRGPGSAVDTTYRYFGPSGNFRLEKIQHGGWGIPADPVDFQFGYDPVGNIRQLTESDAGTLTFGYDSLNRLVSTAGLYDHTYSYDRIGSFAAVNRNGIGQIYLYEGRPQAVSRVVADSGAEIRFVYDLNGNMIERSENGRVMTQQFDAQQRLAGVQTGDGEETRFLYDADGRRTMVMEMGRTIFTPFDVFEVEEQRPPLIAFEAWADGVAGGSAIEIPAGTPYTLTWEAVEARNCAASGGWSGEKPPAGSETIPGFAGGSLEYRLDCGNRFAGGQAEVTVSIAGAGPTATPQPTPSPTGTPAASIGVRINFQSEGAPVPAGYLPDVGTAFGSRGNGFSYGWDQSNTSGRDRQANADQRLDTLIHMQKAGDRIWEIALPNGSYEVTVAAGDPVFIDQVNNLSIEGVTQVDPDGEDNFDLYTVEAAVVDGRLTVAPAAGASNAKLAYIDITSLDPGPTPPPPTPTLTPPPAGCGPTAQEAEAGMLSGRFVVGQDSLASAGAYVHVPEGQGSQGGIEGSVDFASYCLTVPAAGWYRIRGWVHADGGTNDSFFVAIDGEPAAGYLWDLHGSTSYQVDYVRDRGGANPVERYLESGDHNLRIYLREDGARLDRWDLEKVDQTSATAFNAKTITGVRKPARPAALRKARIGRPVNTPLVGQTMATITRKRYRLAGQSIALQVSGDPQGQNGLFYLFADHLGSITAVADSAGNLVDSRRYDPFGRSRISPVTDLTDRGFTGHKMDDELGLIYMNARYYLPEIGRFISPDPLVPDPGSSQAHGRYTYVKNNPIRFQDPSGYCGRIANGSGELIRDPDDSACWYLVDGILNQWRSGAGGAWWEQYYGHTDILLRVANLGVADLDYWEGMWASFQNSGGYYYGPASPSSYSHISPDLEMGYTYFSLGGQGLHGIGGKATYILDKFGNHYLSADLTAGLPGPNFGGGVGFVPRGLSEDELEALILGPSYLNFEGGMDLGGYLSLQMKFSEPLEVGIDGRGGDLSINLASMTWLIYDAKNGVPVPLDAGGSCLVCSPGTSIEDLFFK